MKNTGLNCFDQICAELQQHHKTWLITGVAGFIDIVLMNAVNELLIKSALIGQCLSFKNA